MPEVLAQKRAARDKVLQGLGYAAGKAYDEFYGEPMKKGAPKTDGPADLVYDPVTKTLKKAGG
jgi:hypothetical protein